MYVEKIVEVSDRSFNVLAAASHIDLHHCVVIPSNLQ